MAMTKSELIERIAARQSQLSPRDVELAVKTLIEEMANALADGGRIEIRGFGSFVAKTYDERSGRNPRTGESIHVPKKRLPTFKVGKELRERVDKADADGASGHTADNIAHLANADANRSGRGDT